MSSDWCFGRRLFCRVSSLRSVVVELDFLAQYSYLLYNDLSLVPYLIKRSGPFF